MGHMSIMAKAEERDQQVQAQRALAECFDINNHDPVRKYSTHDDETGQFIEYFYPWERIYIKTNNFEKFGGRTKKSNKCFRSDRELLEYTIELSNPSSNNEDRPPPSEDLFFDSGMEHLYDTVLKTTGYTPRLTLLQCSLLRDLSCYMLDVSQLADASKRIIERRLELIRGYCKELKRKRYAKAYRRFSRVRSKKMGVANEAMELLVEELMDKDLGREFYYAADEPKACQDILLEARREAIKRKYLQYVMDVRYRRMYRNKIYFNVNKDVPAEDTMHMSSADEQLVSDGMASSCCTEVPLIRMRAGEGSPINDRADDWKPTRKTVINTTYKSPRGGVVNVIYAHDQSAANVSSSSPTSPVKYMADVLRKSPIQSGTHDSGFEKESTQNSYYGSPDGGIVSITLSSNVNTASKSDARSPILNAKDLANQEDSILDDTLTENAYITAEDFANDSMQENREPNPADQSIFDNELSRQVDSDIPTSEAEFMSDFGTSISPRMRSKRKRLLKSLHRLLRAEHLRLPSPEETARYLCDIELEAKGLHEQNASDKRVQAIRRKFERFAEDAEFREKYLQRVRSIKEQQQQGFDEDYRTPTRNVRQGAIEDVAQKPKAIIVHHVRRSPTASPAKPGTFPGSPEYFSSQRDLAAEMGSPQETAGESELDQSQNDMDATLIQLPLYGKQTPEWIRNMPEDQQPTLQTNSTFSIPPEQSNYVKFNRTFDVVPNADVIPARPPARRRHFIGAADNVAPARSRKTWGHVVNPFENLDWQPVEQGPRSGPDITSTPGVPKTQARRQAWGSGADPAPSSRRKAWGPVVNPFENLDWQPIAEGRPSSPDIPRNYVGNEGSPSDIEIVDEIMLPSSPYELHASPSSIVQRQMVESTFFQSPGGGLVEIAVQSNLLDENSFRSRNVNQRSFSPDRMPSLNQSTPVGPEYEPIDTTGEYLSAEDQLDGTEMSQYVSFDSTNEFYEDSLIGQTAMPDYSSFDAPAEYYRDSEEQIDQTAMPEYESFNTSAEYIDDSLIDQTAMPEYESFGTSVYFIDDAEDHIDQTTMPEYESYNATADYFDESSVDETAMPEYQCLDTSAEYMDNSLIDQTAMPDYDSLSTSAELIEDSLIEQTTMPGYESIGTNAEYSGDVEDYIDQTQMPEYESYNETTEAYGDSLVDQTSMPEYEFYDTSAAYIEDSSIDQTAMPEYESIDTSAEYFGDAEDQINDATMPEYDSLNSSADHDENTLYEMPQETPDYSTPKQHTRIRRPVTFTIDANEESTTPTDSEDLVADDIDATEPPYFEEIEELDTVVDQEDENIEATQPPEFDQLDESDESDEDLAKTQPPDFTEIDEVESDFDDDDEDIDATEPPEFRDLGAEEVVLPKEQSNTQREVYEEVYEVIEEEFIEIIEERMNADDPMDITKEPNTKSTIVRGQLALPWYDTDQPMESRPNTTANTTFDMSDAMTSRTVDMADLENTESTIRMPSKPASDELIYADVTTAESTFDDEVPSSEQELIPNYDDEQFLRCDDPLFNRPISRSKLKLFIELAKSDPSLNPALQPRPILVPSEVIESDRGHFEQLQLMREIQRVNILEDLQKKRLNLIRHFHAQRTKRLRKLATIRLLAVVDSSKRNVTDPITLEGRMRFAEIRDKGLADRETYYNDDEPRYFSEVLNKRLIAIGNKYRMYYNANEEKRRAILRSIMDGLLEKVTLPKNYP